MEGMINIEQEECELVNHDNDHDFLVTKMMCKDLPDSVRGDFRSWRATDYSFSMSIFSLSIQNMIHRYHIFVVKLHIRILLYRYLCFCVYFPAQ